MELRKEKSIMILPANKRKATVMKDTGEYEHKVTTVLSDDKASDKLTQISYSQNIVSIIKKLKEEDKITER